VFFSGIALDVTPQIDDGENIVLHVHPAISTVSQGKTSLPTGDATVKQVYLPTNEIREADSIVRVQDGRIVAIGGLMKQSQTNTGNQLPGTGNMPVASEIFGNKNQRLVKQELVILIKPTIIRGTSDWQADLTATQERLESLGR
jgi:MSHA biogenesis protein MshL